MMTIKKFMNAACCLLVFGLQAEKPAEPFSFTKDRFKCATVKLSGLKAIAAASIAATEEAVKKDDGNNVLFDIDSTDFSTLGDFQKRGYDIYVVNRDTVKASKWLGDGPSTFPTPPSHVVGCAAVIFNERTQKFLCLLEEGGRATFAGGKVERGESNLTAVARRVKKETGLDILSNHMQVAGKDGKVVMPNIAHASAQTLLTAQGHNFAPFDGSNMAEVIAIHINTDQDPVPNVADGVLRARWFTQAELEKELAKNGTSHARNAFEAYKNRKNPLVTTEFTIKGKQKCITAPAGTRIEL